MRTAKAVALAWLVVASVQGSAAADPDVGGGQENFTLSAIDKLGADHGSGAAQASAGGPSANIEYSYQPVCDRGQGIVGNGFYGCGGEIECGNGDGYLVNVFASANGASPTPLGVQCTGQTVIAAAQQQPPPQVTAAMVARAFRRIPLPESALAIQPPGGETLVNLETVFSTEAEPFRRTVTLLGQRVELDITPASFTWRHGDGSTQRTGEPGRPYERGLPMSAYVTHQYGSLADGLSPSVDTVWTARFRVNGGPWRDVGETVTIEGPPTTLAVREAEPNLVGS